MTAIAVVYHSVSGRTRALAEAVARGAESVTTDGTIVAHVVSAEDARHAQAVLSAADAIVFGCPTYMGSASAQFKAFMDSTSAVWALQGWRDKLAAGFTHSAAPSGDKLGTLTQLAVFAAQHGMVWVGLGLPPTYAGAESPDDDTNRLGSHLGAMAQSRPGGGALHTGDVNTAEHLGRRVAEAALRWGAGERARSGERRADAGAEAEPERHPAARTWAFPRAGRPALPSGIERANLREMVARPARYEHHLMICATVDGAQLEVTTASEPLYFSHINLSDEYALALPTGDELIDRFPLRTFLSDPVTGDDVGRYNHRIGDLVLHPEGLLHWPGRLRPPYEPFDFPPGMRRCGLSLVYCASEPTPATWCPLPRPQGREEDAKAYVTPAPPMVLASTRGAPGVLGLIGRTSLVLLELPGAIAPPHGGWLVVLEAEAGSVHAACDLLRIPEGATLDGAGIVRALLLSSSAAGPDPTPPSWRHVASAPFAAYEDGAPSSLPLDVAHGGLRIEEVSPSVVAIAVGGARAEVPRFWLSRMLHRVAMHGLRLGYAETYGGFFVDDREDVVLLGVRGEKGAPRAAVAVARGEAIEVIERMYRAVAPVGYREREERNR
ncbi:MAG: putative tryptophan repressor-binding protein wrbA [Labilithrix sp.]|nr:putative tryptophan repressor-binding protein wrbA [Labilithrix sp.]